MGRPSLREVPSLGSEAATFKNRTTSQEQKPSVSCDEETAMPEGSALVHNLWEAFFLSIHHKPVMKDITCLTPLLQHSTITLLYLPIPASDTDTEPQKAYQETGKHTHTTRAQLLTVWGFDFCCFNEKMFCLIFCLFFVLFLFLFVLFFTK